MSEVQDSGKPRRERRATERFSPSAKRQRVLSASDILQFSLGQCEGNGVDPAELIALFQGLAAGTDADSDGQAHGNALPEAPLDIDMVQAASTGTTPLQEQVEVLKLRLKDTKTLLKRELTAGRLTEQFCRRAMEIIRPAKTRKTKFSSEVEPTLGSASEFISQDLEPGQHYERPLQDAESECCPQYSVWEQQPAAEQDDQQQPGTPVLMDVVSYHSPADFEAAPQLDADADDAMEKPRKRKQRTVLGSATAPSQPSTKTPRGGRKPLRGELTAKAGSPTPRFDARSQHVGSAQEPCRTDPAVAKPVRSEGISNAIMTNGMQTSAAAIKGRSSPMQPPASVSTPLHATVKRPLRGIDSTPSIVDYVEDMDESPVSDHAEEAVVATAPATPSSSARSERNMQSPSRDDASVGYATPNPMRMLTMGSTSGNRSVSTTSLPSRLGPDLSGIQSGQHLLMPLKAPYLTFEDAKVYEKVRNFVATYRQQKATGATLTIATTVAPGVLSALRQLRTRTEEANYSEDEESQLRALEHWFAKSQRCIKGLKELKAMTLQDTDDLTRSALWNTQWMDLAEILEKSDTPPSMRDFFEALADSVSGHTYEKRLRDAIRDKVYKHYKDAMNAFMTMHWEAYPVLAAKEEATQRQKAAAGPTSANTPANPDKGQKPQAKPNEKGSKGQAPAKQRTNAADLECDYCHIKGHRWRHCHKLPAGTDTSREARPPPPLQSPQRSPAKAGGKPKGSDKKEQSGDKRDPRIEKLREISDNVQPRSDGMQMILRGRIGEEQVRVLLDTGATGCFVDSKLFKRLEAKHTFGVQRYATRDKVIVVDGRLHELEGRGRLRVDLQHPFGEADFTVSLSHAGILPMRDIDIVLGMDRFQVEPLLRLMITMLDDGGRGGELTDELSPVEFARATIELCNEDPTVIDFPGAVEAEGDLECPLDDMCVIERLQASMALDDAPEAHLGETAEMRQRVRQMLARYPILFKEVDADAGCSDFCFPIDFREEIDGLHCVQRPLYGEVAKVCDEQIEQLIKKKFIRPSKSNVLSPVHMVHQKDKYRMCIDYTKLNSMLKTMEAPIPNIKDILHALKGKKYFATLDLSSGYHQFPVRPGDECYTAFKTHDGRVFEFVRIPFGLCNAPAWFQSIMLTILGNAVGTICFNYIDDIIVFGDDEESFLKNLEEVLSLLAQRNLRVNLAKCRFGLRSVEYLGYTLDSDGIRLSEASRVKVQEFPVPKSKKQLQSFLGLANYFRDFVKNFSDLAAPLYNATTNWSPKIGLTDDLLKAFVQLREDCFNATALKFIDYTREIHMRTDASKVGAGGYIFQINDAGVEEPLGFFSKKFNAAQRNWATIDQESFGIFATIMHFQNVLRGHHFLVETDHRNITFLKTSESPRVRRWFIRLSEFRFSVKHIAGVDNVVADALSRCYALSDETSQDVVSGSSDRLPSDDIISKFAACHNHVVGHRGTQSTLFLMRRTFPGTKVSQSDVRELVRRCVVCQKIRATVHAEGIQTTSASCYEPFQRIVIDYAGPFQEDERGNQYILSVVCACTRFKELFAVTQQTALATAECLLQICGRYGCPQEIQSDQGTHFKNQLIEEFTKLLEIEHRFSVPYRPQSNGIVERSNRELKQHLQALVTEVPVLRDSWSIYLPLIQRVLNSTVHDTMGVSPTELVYAGSVDPYRGILTPFKEGERVGSNLEFVNKLHQAHDAIMDRAMKLLQEKDTLYNERHAIDNPKFQIGDLVLWDANEKRNSKLAPKLLGPYKVLQQDKSRLFIQSLASSEQSYWTSIERVRRFLYDPLRPDPSGYAATDKGEYIVESIQDVILVKGKPLLFVTKWKGYDEVSNSPLALVKDSAAFKEFVKTLAKPMRERIRRMLHVGAKVLK